MPRGVAVDGGGFVFRVGDYVEAAGGRGKVVKLDLPGDVRERVAWVAIPGKGTRRYYVHDVTVSP
jgi:hypothetical protein